MTDTLSAQRRLESLATAIRTVPYGGVDDTALDMQLPPGARATISPIVNSARWGALMVGMVFEITRAIDEQRMEIVAAVTVCLFLTCFRTVMPLRLASPKPAHRLTAIADVAILGASVGYAGGTASAFTYSVVVAIVLAAFGWSFLLGAIAMGVGGVSIALGRILDLGPNGFGEFAAEHWADRRHLLFALVTATLIVAAGLIRDRLLDAERRRQTLQGQLESLSETNDLLSMLNGIARTLPMSLNQREAIDRASRQLHETFEPTVICLLELDETNDEWVPKLTEGVVAAPSTPLENLEAPLREAYSLEKPLLISDTTSSQLLPLSLTAESGLYCRLVARDRTIGLLAMEHPTPGHYRERDARLLTGMAEVLALTLDNARWFGRLRSLGAEEERIRIARDLHDRVGQWLTYIGFELERIIDSNEQGSPELNQLYSDVKTALDELRETLRQLRSGVSESRPLAVVGGELVARFKERVSFDIEFDVLHPDEALPVPIENELLRILQEALNNADKHARARRVQVSYDVHDGSGVLAIVDDGVGFDASRGIRDSAYGLVGMRERADSIGARLTIDSTPGVGTAITVRAGTVGEASALPVAALEIADQPGAVTPA